MVPPAWNRPPGDMKRPRSARSAARRPNRSPSSTSQRNSPASAAIMSSSSRSVMPSSVLAVNPSSEMRATVDGRTPYPATRSSSSLGALAGSARGNGCGGGGGAACAGGPRSHRNGCAAEKASLGSMRGFCSTPLFLVLRFRCVRPDRGAGYIAATVACDGPPGARIRLT
jgi:hypothetical protein